MYVWVSSVCILEGGRSGPYIMMDSCGLQPYFISYIQIQINVTDTNDNPPVFPVNTYYINVYESAAVGQTVLTVAASDKDTSSNAAITYSLQGTAAWDAVPTSTYHACKHFGNHFCIMH